MNALIGIKNFLQIVSDNWVLILVCVGIVFDIYQQTKVYLSKSKDEKIEIAKKQISEIMLRMITDAEKDFLEWNKSGSIKRAKVIEEIFNNYPILSKAKSQEEIIAWIDLQIDESLKTLRKVIKENSVEKTV